MIRNALITLIKLNGSIQFHALNMEHGFRHFKINCRRCRRRCSFKCVFCFNSKFYISFAIFLSLLLTRISMRFVCLLTTNMNSFRYHISHLKAFEHDLCNFPPMSNGNEDELTFGARNPLILNSILNN